MFALLTSNRASKGSVGLEWQVVTTNCNAAWRRWHYRRIVVFPGVGLSSIVTQVAVAAASLILYASRTVSLTSGRVWNGSMKLPRFTVSGAGGWGPFSCTHAPDADLSYHEAVSTARAMNAA